MTFSPDCPWQSQVLQEMHQIFKLNLEQPSTYEMHTQQLLSQNLAGTLHPRRFQNLCPSSFSRKRRRTPAPHPHLHSGSLHGAHHPGGHLCPDQHLQKRVLPFLQNTCSSPSSIPALLPNRKKSLPALRLHPVHHQNFRADRFLHPRLLCPGLQKPDANFTSPISKRPQTTCDLIFKQI